VESTVAGNEHVWLIVPDKFKVEIAAVIGASPRCLKEVWHLGDPFHPGEGYTLLRGAIDATPHYAMAP
jgi:hypothetical protein